MKEIFSENPVYLILAIVGTSLYLLKMIIFVFVGSDDGGDFDSDLDATSGDSFSLVSTQSILAFFMGAGWIGLAAKREWSQEDLPALLIASGFGFLMMLFSSFLTFQIKKFNYTPQSNPQEAVGKKGRVYSKIPAKGEGMGQVEITVGGKQQILQASSADGEIQSFESIIVKSVDDSGNLLVKKV